MKKLFAGIVAALAFIPVVANAASYKVGDYVNYAGSESDWSAFHAAGTQEQILDFWENTGVGTLYLGEGHTGYNRSLSLVANTLISGVANSVSSGTLYNKVVAENRKEAVSPYGYATTATDGIDVEIATLADITALFGVSTAGQTVELNDKNLAVFQIMTADKETLDEDDTVYIFTKSEDSATAGNYFAIKLTRADSVVTKAELVSHAVADTTIFAGLFSVIEMNKDYVCTEAPESSYVCYECTTEDNQTEYLWRIEGSQPDNCKKSTKITSKAKCVKSPKTGVDNYLIPAAVVLAVCAIVLTVLKRKDAFKAI